MQHGTVLHHVGYVVESIQKAAATFAASLALDWDGRIIHDPLQQVCVSFFQPRSPGNPVFELVEPASQDSPVAGFLRRGGGYHHLCYEVDSLEEQLGIVRENGDLIARMPLPAVAFDGRRIAWVFTRNNMLLEYLERRKPGPGA